MIHFRRYLAALLVLSASCGAYSMLVAPWIEPPPIVRRPPVESPQPAQSANPARADLAALFREGEWERDTAKVKVIDTETATLLIQDYLPTPDGQMELRPCTIIVYANNASAADDGAKGTAAKATKRPIVLQAQAALLQFNQPVDLGKAQMGRLEKGLLPGQVRIFSPPTDPQKRDGLIMTTQNVRFDRSRIFTQSEVEFAYGDSFGSGSDLTISLANEADGKTGRGKSFGGVQSLTLERIKRLHLVAIGQGLLGDATKPASKSVADPAAPLELTCRGPLTVDVLLQRIQFEQQVEVQRVTAGAPPDRLRCERLVLDLASPKPEVSPVVGGTSKPATDHPGQTATDGNQAASDPLAGRLNRLTAIGSPAVLEAPSNGIRATAASMDYSPHKRLITLKSDDENLPSRKITQVSLQQLGQHFVAEGIQYEMAEPGRLGRLWAAGPGELRLIQTRGPTPQPIVAHWDRELLVRPDGKNQVITFQGAASVAAEPLGQFDADELHLWVLEVPNETAPSADRSPHAPREESVTRSVTSTDLQPRVAIIPDRLMASGKVRVTSPQLDVETASLKAWFVNLPPAAKTTSPANTAGSAIPVTPAGPAIQQPQQPGASVPPAAAGGVVRHPNLQKFHVAGDEIQMQLVLRGQQFELEDLTIDGLKSIDETRTPEPNQEPIRILGKSLELRRGTTPQATIKISGQRAEVAGRGVSLAGDTIVVRRGENWAQIDGPGEATLPIPEDSGAGNAALLPGPGSPALPRRPAEFLAPPANRPPQKLNVVWQQGMTFDGQLARLSGAVECRTPTQLTVSRTLDVTLTERINFSAMQGAGQQAQIARVHLAGDVLIKNWGKDELGQQLSFDQMFVPNLTLDQVAGTLHADGPGWVNSVRRGAAGLPGAPAGQLAAFPTPPAANNNNPQSLTGIHVDFEHAIEGQLASRRIQFQRQVRTTYSPANQFTDVIAADRLAGLDPRAVLMTSDRLTVNDMLLPNAHWIEMQATGNVHVEGNGFTVQAALVGYTSDKEVLTVEGDFRADAHIWRQGAPGQPPDETSLKKIWYNLRTGQLQGDGFRQMDFRNLQNNMRIGLPIPGQK